MIEKLLKWLDNATCNFLAVETIKDELENAGFTELRQEDAWDIKPGSRYYVVKNDSAIFPFITGTGDPEESAFRIITAHSDSPCFKIKPQRGDLWRRGVVSLNVEKYGGGILYTWFDRPLSMSGRVMVDCGDLLNPETIVFDLKRPVATIPHLAIHFNRGVNNGNPLSVQKDMKPVMGYFSPEEIAEAKSKGGVVKKSYQNISAYFLRISWNMRSIYIHWSRLSFAVYATSISSRHVLTISRWRLPGLRHFWQLPTSRVQTREFLPYSITRRPAPAPSRGRWLHSSATSWRESLQAWVRRERDSSAA